jgi:oxygen-dependent protoporphyrinogen oxidase
VKIAVVGGGVAGLAAAVHARDRGHEVVVLEAAARPGGRVDTERRDGFVIERGAGFVLDDAPALQRMVARLQLALVRSDEALAKRRYLMRGGELVALPASPPAAVMTTLLSPLEKLRALMEPMVRRRRSDGDESLAAFARRRLGRAGWLLDTMQVGIYGGDPERLSAQSSFPRLVEMERGHGSIVRGAMAAARDRRRSGAARGRLSSLPGGLGALPAALAKLLDGALHTGARVDSIERAGGRLRLSAGGAPIEADRVVLALPPGDAARACRQLDAGLADAYAQIPVSSVAAVTLGWPRAALRHPLDGVGLLVPPDENDALLGILWMSSLLPDVAPPGHANLRCMIGGRMHADALELSDEQLRELAIDRATRLLGATGAPSLVHITRWPAAIPQYELGHAARVATIDARGSAAGLWSTGAALRGVGVNDVLADAESLASRMF